MRLFNKVNYRKFDSLICDGRGLYGPIHILVVVGDGSGKRGGWLVLALRLEQVGGEAQPVGKERSLAYL